MKKKIFKLSIALNLLLGILACIFYMNAQRASHDVDFYRTHYLPQEMYTEARDKIDDYEWIFRHIAKVENIDMMRRQWCKR